MKKIEVMKKIFVGAIIMLMLFGVSSQILAYTINTYPTRLDGNIHGQTYDGNFYKRSQHVLGTDREKSTHPVIDMAATGKLDAKTAVAWAGSVTIIGGAVLGVCARFIPEGEQKKLAKK